MSRYLILAQSEVTGKALGKWLELLGEPALIEKDDRLIVAKDVAALDGIRAVEFYETMTARFEDQLASAHSGNLVVIVDTVRPEHLNPLAEGGWDHLLAMLILSFPEIQWFFGMISGNSNTALSSDETGNILYTRQKSLREFWQKQVEPYHSLLALVTAPSRDSLFDPTGLRNFVRSKANEKFLTSYLEEAASAHKPIGEADLVAKEKTLLPVRGQKAAAIDEELNYAHFHAFTAYRFGYRADAVRSWALMASLFNCYCYSGKDEKCNYVSSCTTNHNHGFHLLLEDVNLNFPDKPGRIHLSKFEEERAKHCNLLSNNPKLETSRFRVIVTSGHSGADKDKIDDNLAFVERYKTKDRCKLVFKPVGGMFDLWSKAGLGHFESRSSSFAFFCRPGRKRGGEKLATLPGRAPGFHWPPEVGKEAEDAGGHSAPGKLMLIAQHLVRRADCLKDSANTVEESIRGAVLATDALELLRYQTPTLALQALCLKHEFEVIAEVAFLGVSNQFALKPRLDELEREVEAASRFFEGNRRKEAELDTRVSIANRLMLIFREAGQFDEEMDCLIYIRKWHRELLIEQADSRCKKIAQHLMRYPEWLLESPVNFSKAIFGWLFMFWIVFRVASFIPECSLLLYLDKLIDANSVSKAWNLFISNNPPDGDYNIPLLTINAFATALGIFHLGVFISYLYSAVTRK